MFGQFPSAGAVVLLLSLLAAAGAPPPAGAQNVPGQQPGQPPANQPGIVPGVPAQPGQTGQRPRVPPANVPASTSHVVKLEQLTKDQFRALPDGAMIEAEGLRTTKREFLEKMTRERNAALASVRVRTSEVRSRLAARRAQFLQHQKAELDARNAKVQAEVEKFLAAPAPPATGGTLR
jgi:hypothetical protein